MYIIHYSLLTHALLYLPIPYTKHTLTIVAFIHAIENQTVTTNLVLYCCGVVQDKENQANVTQIHDTHKFTHFTWLFSQFYIHTL